MTYQVAFLAADDPAVLLVWLAEVTRQRFGYVPTFALTALVGDTFPDEWVAPEAGP